MGLDDDHREGATLVSGARFRLRNITQGGPWSPFADGGFIADAGDVIEAQLEDTPALDIHLTIFTDEDRSDGRSVVAFSPVNGVADPPTGSVFFTLPMSEWGTWAIQCQTNGGAVVLDAAGRPDTTVHTKTRFVAVLTPTLGFRHPLAAETTHFTPGAPAGGAIGRGVAVALQEMLDAVDAANGGAGVPATAPFVLDTSTPLGSLPNAVLVRALAATLAFLRSGGTPATFAHQAAAGTTQEAVGVIREVTAAGAGTIGTGASVGWYTRDAAGLPVIRLMGRESVVLTAISGANLTAGRTWFTVNAGVEAAKMGLAADGGLRLHAYTTESFPFFSAAGTGSVQAVQPRILCNGSVDVPTFGFDITNLGTTINYLRAFGVPLSASRVESTYDTLFEVFRVRLLLDAPGEVGTGPQIAFSGWHDGDDEAELAAIAAEITDPDALSWDARLVFKAAEASSLTVVGWWGANGLHVATDLIVAGTTTTVDSTTVTVSDRLVVFNSSTGIVPVPVAIAGWVIDRGSVDGITKRDAPGIFWDEGSTYLAAAFNTALDQSTIGTFVTLRAGGLRSPTLDNPSGTVTIGAAATSVTVTPNTTVTGTLAAGATTVTGTLSVKEGGTDLFKVDGATGAQTHTIDNWVNITTTSGSKIKVEAQGSVLGTGSTTPWSYALPSSCNGSIKIVADLVETTISDMHAHYEFTYLFKRRSGGSVTLTKVGVDVEVEVTDAAWDAAIVESGGTLSFKFELDSANQTSGGGRVVLDITPYTTT